MKFTYLLVNLFSFIIPFIFSFHPKLKFNRKFPFFLIANLMVTFIFLVWDYIFLKHGIWSFNPDYISGIYLFDLPLEEILFFICIPFACLFTYHCIGQFREGKEFTGSWSRVVSLLLVTVSIVIAILNPDKSYSFVTFVSLAITIVVIEMFMKPRWMGRFYISIMLLIVPFLVVDGILTGCCTAEPVVIYNDSENLSLRLFSIPVEDFFYAILMLMLNTTIMEILAGKLNQRDIKIQ